MNEEIEPPQQVAAWKRDAIVEVFPSKKRPIDLSLIEAIGHPVTVSVFPDDIWEERKLTLLSLAPVAPSVEDHLALRDQAGQGIFFSKIDWLVHKGFGVFFVAGDGPQIGPYAGVPEAFPDILANNVALPPAAFPAYPHEEHKRAHGIIHNEILNRALSYKQEVVESARAVTQINLEARIIADWIVRERKRGITMPFYVNIFPPLTYRLIAAYVNEIGLVNAKHIIATFPDPIKFAVEFAKGYSTDKLLLDLAQLRADVAGIVVTSTNRLEIVKKWLESPVEP